MTVPPAPTGRFGLEYQDIQEAMRAGSARPAIAFYEREGPELERRGQRLDAARAHLGVAFIAIALGVYQKGIRSGHRCLELASQEPPGPQVATTQARCYSVLGQHYLQVGDIAEARRQLALGSELTAKAEFERPQHAASFAAAFSRGLAEAARRQGDYRAAVEHGEQAIRTFDSVLAQMGRRGGPRRDFLKRQQLVTLIGVAKARREQRRLDEAEATLQRALALAQELSQRGLESSIVGEIGQVALARKDYAAALEHFERALRMAPPFASPIGIGIFHGMGRAFAGQGRHGRALGALLRAIDRIENVRSRLQEAEFRSGFLEDKDVVYREAVQAALTVGRNDEAFVLAERVRARSFLDMLGNQTTLSKGRTRALVEEETTLRARLAAARAASEEGEDTESPVAAREDVEAAERAYRGFLDRVRKENAEQASLMTVEPVSLQEVQRLLPEGTTLLEYLVAESEVVVWIVSPQRSSVVRLPASRARLVAEVRDFRAALAEGRPLADIESRARALHDRLLARARRDIVGDRLLIVPHDVLHYLPFAALRTAQGRWLVDDYALGTLPSASVLKYLAGKGQSASRHALAIGNPDLGPALNLRWAEREARAVGQTLPGSTVLLRQDATEARAKALGPQAGLLHFATHGELSEVDPLASALLLVPDAAEDGRLEVRELLTLELTARLVVLSACETGLGKLSRGDELVGLQRAFLYAGAPAVITTLWKVDDRASFALMRAFYEALDARGPAAALREAQRATAREFPHPFAWAAFGLTGVPR